MAAENLVSSFNTTLDTLPIQMLTTGEGGPGWLKSINDNIAATAVGIGTVASTYRLCRFPTAAKIKSVTIDLGNLDTSGSVALVLDINVAFSDSFYDGTQPVYTASNGATALNSLCIPKTGAAGTTTSITAYTNPNKLFGTLAASSNAAKYNTNVTFNGSYTNWFPGGRDLPLWNFFGFTNAQGQPADPGGFFDLLLYVSTAAATGAAASIGAKVEYII
jgi:hypothetical protein